MPFRLTSCSILLLSLAFFILQPTPPPTPPPTPGSCTQGCNCDPPTFVDVHPSTRPIIAVLSTRRSVAVNVSVGMQPLPTNHFLPPRNILRLVSSRITAEILDMMSLRRGVTQRMQTHVGSCAMFQIALRLDWWEGKGGLSGMACR